MSRPGISGIALPAMPCRSPTIPTVEPTTARICASSLRPLLAHKLSLPFEVVAHVVEFLDHGFDALAEIHAGSDACRPAPSSFPGSRRRAGGCSELILRALRRCYLVCVPASLYFRSG